MTKLRLDTLLLVFLCLFAFSLVFSVTAIEAALFAALGLALYRTHGEGKLKELPRALSSHPLFVPWAVFIGVCLLTALTAYFPRKALGQVNSDLLRYVCFAGLLLALRPGWLPWLSRAYALAAAGSAVVGIGQVLHIFPTARDMLNVRAGAFMNPVRYGEVMAIALVMILAQVVAGREAPKKERVFYAASGLLVFAALVLSQTRGAYLGFAVALPCFLLFARGLRLRVLAMFGVLAAAGLAAAFLNPSISSRFSLNDPRYVEKPVMEEAANIRLELWQVGWQMFRAHPVLGVGPDNIKPLFKTFKPDLVFGAVWGSIHNLYLHQAAERGLVGLGALLFLFYSFLRFALKNLRGGLNPYTLWAACLLPAYFAMNLTENSFQHVHTSFAVMLALAASAASLEKDRA